MPLAPARIEAGYLSDPYDLEVLVRGLRRTLDIAAQQPVNILGLVIYSVLAGLVGMLVLTLIERWLEPLRFLD